MKYPQLSEDIIPVGEFKTHLAQVLQKLKKSGRPVVVTQNGRPAAIMVSPQDFDHLLERECFFEAVREGLADVQSGRVITDKELEKQLSAEFGSLKDK